MATIDLEVEESSLFLKEYLKQGFMSPEEAKELLRQRTIYLTKFRSPEVAPVDFKRAIDYEIEQKDHYNLRAIEHFDEMAKSDRKWNFFIANLYHKLSRKFGKKSLEIYIEQLRFMLNEFGYSPSIDSLAQKILEAHPQNPEAWILVASLQVSVIGDFDSARKIFQSGLRLNPNSIKIFSEWIRLELKFIEKIYEKEFFEKISENENDEKLKEFLKGQLVIEIINNVMTSKIEEIEKIEFLKNLKEILGNFENIPEARNNIEEVIRSSAESLDLVNKYEILYENVEEIVEKTPKNLRKNLNFLTEKISEENREFLEKYVEDFGDDLCALFIQKTQYLEVPESFTISRFFDSIFSGKNLENSGNFKNLQKIFFDEKINFSNFSKISEPKIEILKIFQKIGKFEWKFLLKILYSAFLVKNVKNTLSIEAKNDKFFLIAELSQIYKNDPKSASKLAETAYNYFEDDEVALICFKILFNENLNYSKLLRKSHLMKWDLVTEASKDSASVTSFEIEAPLTLEEIAELFKE